jgi:Carboxypeptidase regulatory-like domain
MQGGFTAKAAKYVLGLIATLILSCLFALPAFAALTGDIQGTVLDPTGAVVPGAKVIIKNTSTGVSRVLTTDQDGQFAALQLDLGTYQITVEKEGLRKYIETTIIRSGEKTRVDASMQVGKVEEVVNVETKAATLDVATAQVSNSIDAEQIVTLPSQNRDPVAFAALAPGTVPVTMDNPFLGSGSFNSNGSRGRANNITVDNAISTDISTTGSSGTGTFSLDGVQEFKLISNNFDAEFGRNSGSQVQIITRSGTNAYHGTAYWFHQNSAFNARDYFDDTGKATPLIRNLGGFTAGGPVIKDHTFVFGHWELLRIRGGGASRVANVLTPAQAAAITDPTSKALFQAVGAPTSASGQLSGAAPNQTNQHSWSLRVDQVFRGGKDTMFARYGDNPTESVDPGLTFITGNLPNFGASVTSRDQTFTFGYTSTLTSNVVNQFRFNFGRSNPTFPAFSTLKPPFAPEIIIQGSQGFDPLGVSNILPQGRTQNTFQYGDTLSWVRGRHQIKFGGDVLRYQAYSFFDANFRGTATFANLQAFQQGQLRTWTQRFGSSNRHNFSTDIFGFVQDDYRITDALTLNLGFRLETSGGVSEKNGILSNLDPKNTTPLGGGGTGPLGGIDLGGEAFQRNWNPAPRVGFAWNPHRSKFVLRAGYGIAYDYIFLNPITNLRFSAPFVPSITVQQFTGTNTLANFAAGTAQAQSDANAAIGQFLSTQKNFGNLSPVDQNLENPRNEQWNVGVQYSALKDTIFKLSYIGTHNDHLQASIPINLVQPGLRPAPATSLADEAARLTLFNNVFVSESGNASGTIVNNRLDPRFNSVTQVQSVGTSTYHAIELQAIRRFNNGLSFDASYTWAHSIDDVSDVLGVLVNDAANLQDPSHGINANRGNSQFDIRNRFVLSYSYELPFARHSSGVIGHALGGWGVSGVADVRSGFPVTIFSGSRFGISDIALNGNSVVRANGSANGLNFGPHADFGSSCLRGVNTGASGCSGTNAGNFPLTQPLLGNIGNSGRNQIRLDGLANSDFAIFKNTKITESKNLLFRWEFYNVFNHPNFSQFVNTLSSGSFGQYQGTATNMRQMQASLKFTF